MPYRVKGRKGWRGQVRIKNGKYLRKQFPTYKRAVIWEENTRASIEKIGGILTLSVLSARYYAYLDNRQTTWVKRAKKNLILRLGKEWGDIELDKITSYQIQLYLREERKKRGTTAANTDLKNMKAMWNWGKEYLGVKYDPVSQIKPFPHDTRQPYTPTHEEVLRVLRIAGDEMTALITCYLTTGARKQELLNLTWEDVSFNPPKLRLGTRKTRDGSLQYDWVYLHPDAVAVLRNRWAKNHQDKRVFSINSGQLFYQLRLLCKEVNITEFQPHGLRRLFATLLMENGFSLKAIQLLLRHKSIKTTELYIKNLNHNLGDLIDKIPFTGNVSPTDFENIVMLKG